MWVSRAFRLLKNDEEDSFLLALSLGLIKADSWLLWSFWPWLLNGRAVTNELNLSRSSDDEDEKSDEDEAAANLTSSRFSTGKGSWLLEAEKEDGEDSVRNSFVVVVFMVVVNEAVEEVASTAGSVGTCFGAVSSTFAFSSFSLEPVLAVSLIELIGSKVLVLFSSSRDRGMVLELSIEADPSFLLDFFSTRAETASAATAAASDIFSLIFRFSFRSTLMVAYFV